MTLINNNGLISSDAQSAAPAVVADDEYQHLCQPQAQLQVGLLEQQLAPYIGNSSVVVANNSGSSWCCTTSATARTSCPLSMRRVAMELNDEACKLSEEGKYGDATEILRQSLILAVSSVVDPSTSCATPSSSFPSSSRSHVFPLSEANQKLPSLLPVFHKDMSPQAHLHHVYFDSKCDDYDGDSTDPPTFTPSTLSGVLMFNLALMYRKTGSTDEAARLNGMAASALQSGADSDGTGIDNGFSASGNTDECMVYVYALNNLGECYYQQGRRNEAAGALTEAARAARWFLNFLQQQQEEKEQGARTISMSFTTALFHHVTNTFVKVTNNLGLLQYQSGDLSGTLSLLDEALGLVENYCEDRDNFATIQMNYNIGLVLESMAANEASAASTSCISIEDLVHRAREMFKLAQDRVLRLIVASEDGDLGRKYGEFTPRICVLIINKMALFDGQSADHGANEDILLLLHEALNQRLDLSFRQGLDGAELAAEINRIGAAYSDGDDHDRALSMYFEGLRLEMAVLGPTHTNVLVTLNNIGQSLHIKGKYEAALSYYEKALAIRDGLSGQADHLPVTPTLLHNCALIHMHTGRQSDALPYFRASLSLQRAMEESGVASCDKDVMASTLYNVGTIMMDKGCLEQACTALTESIAIRSSTDSDNVDTAEALFRLAQIQYARGKVMQALDAYENILTLDLPPQEVGCRSMAIQSLSNMAQICHSVGNLDQALDHYCSALDLLKSSPSSSSLSNVAVDENLDIRTRTKIVSILGAIAGIHSERGEVREAELYYTERTRIQRVGYSGDGATAACGADVAAPAA